MQSKYKSNYEEIKEDIAELEAENPDSWALVQLKNQLARIEAGKEDEDEIEKWFSGAPSPPKGFKKKHGKQKPEIITVKTSKKPSPPATAKRR